MLLEELGIDYKIKPINISKGEQFDPAFLVISPNNRIPAIVDHAPQDNEKPISIFESGAILLYLADKTQRFIPADLRGRNECLKWLLRISAIVTACFRFSVTGKALVFEGSVIVA